MPITKGHGNPNWTREETMLAMELAMTHYPTIPGKHSVEVGRLSDELRALGVHSPESRNEKFRNQHGVYMKMLNLLSLHPNNAQKRGLTISKMDELVWNEYFRDPDRLALDCHAIRRAAAELRKAEAHPFEIEQIDEFREGKILSRLHSKRERAPGLRARVLKQARKADGCFQCPACGFRYGDRTTPVTRAAAAFEVHHLKPLMLLNETGTKTRLADVVLLCANCHRIIHAMLRESDTHVGLAELRCEVDTQ